MKTRTSKLGWFLLLGGIALGGCAAEIEGQGVEAAADPATASEAALSQSCAPDAPADLTVPDGNRMAFKLLGVGDQIYACTQSATGYSWTFQFPDADLLRSNGQVAGIHYAGPTWEAIDGSTVAAARAAGVTVDTSAVPWLLLRATTHSPSGVMSKVTYIQRLHTTGGIAPSADTCNADHLGEVANVPYTADYYFYGATTPAGETYLCN